MKKKYLLRFAALFLCVAMLISGTGCMSVILKEIIKNSTQETETTVGNPQDSTQGSILNPSHPGDETQAGEFPTSPEIPSMEIPEGNVDKSLSFRDFCDKLVREEFEADPISTHFSLKNPAGYGIEYEDEEWTFGVFSWDDYEGMDQEIIDCISQLKSYDYDSMTKEEKLTYDCLYANFVNQYAFLDTYKLQSFFSPNNGIVANISMYFVEYVFYDASDVQHYLDFTRTLPAYIDSLIEATKVQIAEGYFIDAYNVDENIDVIDAYLEEQNNPYIITFDDKIDALGIKGDAAASLKKQNTENVDAYITPCYEKLKTFLEENHDAGKDLGGLCQYGKSGNKRYAAIIRDKTSMDVTPEETIQLLDSSIKKYFNELIRLARMDYDTYEESFTYQPPYSTPGAALKNILKQMEKDFPAPVTTEYNIEYQNPACEIEGSLAYYMTAPIDDYHINNIKVNGSAIRDDKLSLYTTIAHEGYPGHLYQITNFTANENVHDVRKILNFIGSTEGWAEYASDRSLDYLGISDTLARFIQLNNIISNILVSRIDLGVNYEGWSLKQVKTFISEYYNVDDDWIKGIYYSVIGDPGLMLPYTVGHIQFDKMRETAEQTLDEKFSALAFHKFIIEEIGIAPFGVYEKYFQEWLEAQASV